MERNTTLSHRITQDKKNEFDAAFGLLQSNIISDKNKKISKEDFLEALISFSGKITWKEIKTIIDSTEK